MSRAGHVPDPCTPSEGQRGCECPWETVGSCASGCAVDDLEVFADADAGGQLCRPDHDVARPALPTDANDPRVCPSAGVRCVDGSVRVCDAAGHPERLVAVCVYGCAPGILVDHGESAIVAGLPAILCRRRHADPR